jgi:trigger factor
MAIAVETLEKLERKMTLSLPVGSIQSEVTARLKKLARTVKMDGFRPGKVPMNVVAQRYGYSVQYEVMNDKVGEAFYTAANEAKLRVAGQPKINEKDGAAEGEMAFEAVFEVFPEVKIGDLATAEVEKLTTEVSDAAIEKTIEILRKQRRTFSLRPHDAPRKRRTAWWLTLKARLTVSRLRVARPMIFSSSWVTVRCSRSLKKPLVA